MDHTSRSSKLNFAASLTVRRSDYFNEDFDRHYRWWLRERRGRKWLSVAHSQRQLRCVNSPRSRKYQAEALQSLCLFRVVELVAPPPVALRPSASFIIHSARR